MTQYRDYHGLSPGLTAAAAVAAAGVLAGHHAVAAVPVLVAGPGGVRQRNVLALVGWIVGGAVAGGGVGWGVAQAAAPTAEALAVIFGAAMGGGLAAVVRLYVVGDTDEQEPESVTIDSGATTAPDPEPVDLFEGSPDPILYFDDDGDGPVVRAANPAFVETFDVDAATVENEALGDAVMAVERTGAVVEAAASGELFDDLVACESGDETVPFRVRTTTVDSPAGTRGYVLYTPVSAEQ